MVISLMIAALIALVIPAVLTAFRAARQYQIVGIVPEAGLEPRAVCRRFQQETIHHYARRSRIIHDIFAWLLSGIGSFTLNQSIGDVAVMYQ